MSELVLGVLVTALYFWMGVGVKVIFHKLRGPVCPIVLIAFWPLFLAIYSFWDED